MLNGVLNRRMLFVAGGLACGLYFFSGSEESQKEVAEATFQQEEEVSTEETGDVQDVALFKSPTQTFKKQEKAKVKSEEVLLVHEEESEKEMTVLLSQVAEDFNNGDLQAVIVAMQSVLQKDPRNLAAQEALAMAYLESGDLLAAEKQFHDVLGVVPGHALALENLAGIYESQGQTGRAIEVLTQQMKKHPKLQAAPTLLGSLLLHKGDYQGAERILSDVNIQNKGKPRGPLVHALGGTYLKTGQYKKAVELFEDYLPEIEKMAQKKDLRPEAKELLSGEIVDLHEKIAATHVESGNCPKSKVVIERMKKKKMTSDEEPLDAHIYYLERCQILEG